MYLGKKHKRFFWGSAKTLFTLLVVVSLLLFTAAFVSAEDEPEDITTVNGLPCKAGEVLVKYSKTESFSKIAYSLNSVGSSAQNTLPEDIVIADVPDGETIESFMEELENTHGVEYVQPNYIYKLSATTVNDTLSSNQWYLEKIGVYDAWDTTMGSADIKVAVLDTGADLEHEDLGLQIVAQTDVVDNDGSAADDHGHGTHVAGIIAAEANNAKGVAGVAPGCRLIIVDVFGINQLGEWVALTSDSIKGINYAVSQGANIINMSLGGYDNDMLFEEAIDSAVQSGVVCIGAAGNDGDNIANPELATMPHYPSDYDSCISVISTDQNDLKSGFSNYGPEKDISAPGESIGSTYIGNEYVYMSGTSMATPVVSGVAALILSVNPALTVDEVKNILYTTAVDLGEEGRDDVYGNGRVDAASAAAAAASSLNVLSVELDTDLVEISTNGVETLTATVYPAWSADKTVTWSSSNEAAATVLDGVVTPQGVGSTVITVTTNDGSFTDTCSVNVLQGPDGISLDISETSVYAGDSFTLTASVLPEEAVDKSVTWSTSNPDVAVVENGVVTVVGKGTADITASTTDGGYIAACTVSAEKANIDSTVYNISRDTEIITGIAENTSVTQMKSNLAGEPSYIKVYSQDGTEYTGDTVATGMAVKLVRNGIINDELTIVVGGDVSGDGMVSIADYTLVRLNILDLKALAEPFILPADVNGDGTISIADYTLIRLHILQLKSLY